MQTPFAALTFAACFYCLISIFLTRDKNPETAKRNYIPWLIGITAAAGILRIILYPHHAGPMNDDMYIAQMARIMLDPAFVPINNFEPAPGWPFLVSLFFWITGPNQYTLYYANSIIGCLSVVAIFFMVYGITGKSAAGLAAAALLAVSPLHTMWSICGAGFAPALLFVILSLAGLFWFFRLHAPHYIYLCIFSASLAAQISAENLLLLVAIPPAIFFLCRELFVLKKIALHMLAPCVLTIPTALHYMTARLLQSMPAQGAATSKSADAFITLLIEKVSTEISRIAASGNFTMMLIALAAAGLVLGWKKYSKPMVLFAVLGAAYIMYICTMSEVTAFREHFHLYTDLCLMAIASFSVHCLVENYPRARVAALALCLAAAAACSTPAHIANMNPDNDYFYYGKTMSRAMDRIQAELPQDAILIVEDPAPFQAVTSITTISPLIAIAQAQNLMHADNVYFLMDISAGNINELFFDVFKLKIEYAIPLRITLPNGRQSGLYKVVTTDLTPLQQTQ